MSFNGTLMNATTSNNGSTAMGCLSCANSDPEHGLPSLKPNVAILVIGLGVTLILVAAVALIARCLRPHLTRDRQDGESRAWEGAGKERNLLELNIIKNLPLVVFSSDKFRGTDQSPDCAVCLSPFEEKEEMRLLPNCKHMFHPSCVDGWLSTHPTCPLCRSTIISSWTLRNALGLGRSSRRVTVAPFGIPLNEASFRSAGSVSGEVSGSSCGSSRRLEITVLEDENSLLTGSHSRKRSSSWCGGTAVVPRNSKELSRDGHQGQSGSSGICTSPKKLRKSSEVYDIRHLEYAGQSSEPAQSLFIFVPQASARSGPSFVSNASVLVSRDSGSAISKLHEEVRISVEASTL